jgi:nitroreductase
LNIAFLIALTRFYRTFDHSCFLRKYDMTIYIISSTRFSTKIAQLGDSLPYSRCANHPAVAIIPCGDLSKAIEGEMAAFWINDVSAATENLLLAAHSMGLGAVWTGLHPDMNRAHMVQQLLGLPEHIIPLCVVPVGVPAEQPEVKDKYKPENIHYNAW